MVVGYTPTKTQLDKDRLALLDIPTSLKQFAKHVGSGASKIMRRYHGFGWVYVYGHCFNEATGKWVPMYKAGNRPDAIKPDRPPRAPQPKAKATPPLPIVPLAKPGRGARQEPAKRTVPLAVARYFKQNPSASVLLRGGVTYRRGEL